MKLTEVIIPFSPLSTSCHGKSQVVIMNQLKQLLKAIIDNWLLPQKAAKSNEIKVDEKSKKEKVPTLKMDFKIITEVYVTNKEIQRLCWWLFYSWDAKAYKYKIIDTDKVPEEVTELNEYIFIVYTCIGKCDSFDS